MSDTLLSNESVQVIVNKVSTELKDQRKKIDLLQAENIYLKLQLANVLANQENFIKVVSNRQHMFCDLCPEFSKILQYEDKITLIEPVPVESKRDLLLQIQEWIEKNENKFPKSEFVPIKSEESTPEKEFSSLKQLYDDIERINVLQENVISGKGTA